MPKQEISLRGMAIAALAAAAFSLPLISVAQAQQGHERKPATRSQLKHPHVRVATKDSYLYRRGDIEAYIAQHGYNPWTPRFERPWPGGPGYYGSTHPGVTFDEPWEPWWK